MKNKKMLLINIVSYISIYFMGVMIIELIYKLIVETVYISHCALSIECTEPKRSMLEIIVRFIQGIYPEYGIGKIIFQLIISVIVFSTMIYLFKIIRTKNYKKSIKETIRVLVMMFVISFLGTQLLNVVTPNKFDTKNYHENLNNLREEIEEKTKLSVYTSLDYKVPQVLYFKNIFHVIHMMKKKTFKEITIHEVENPYVKQYDVMGYQKMFNILKEKNYGVEKVILHKEKENYYIHLNNKLQISGIEIYLNGYGIDDNYNFDNGVRIAKEEIEKIKKQKNASYEEIIKIVGGDGSETVKRTEIGELKFIRYKGQKSGWVDFYFYDDSKKELKEIKNYFLNGDMSQNGIIIHKDLKREYPLKYMGQKEKRIIAENRNI